MIDKWDIKHILLNLETLKAEYDSSLMSFSYFNKHELVKHKREMKKKIYSVKGYETRKDKIWMYLNGDTDRLTIDYLISMQK